MAQITAERLVEHLERLGYLMMQGSPAPIAMRQDVMGHFVLPQALWAMGWLCTGVIAVVVAIMFATWCLEEPLSQTPMRASTWSSLRRSDRSPTKVSTMSRLNLKRRIRSTY
jgi:hypothetical protein